VELVKEGIVEGWAQDFYGTPVGTAASDIDFARPANSVDRDSGMGNLVTDAYRAKTLTPIGITANGWISEKIWAGPIVGADVFHAVSYGFDPETGLGFKLQTLELSGADIVAVLEFTLWQSDVFDPDFFLQTSGLTFRYDSRRDPFDRVLPASVRVGGEPLDPAAMYGITVNDGSAALIGLLEDAIGITAVNVTPLPVPEYVALRDYIEGLGTVAYGTQGRIQDIGRSGKKK
ncbi:MAG TPA: 5'-nucleotidase, partial [Thermoanaerobaculia bacterium]|nr:5'-nucleotidase [Thermoanaerobaculia bacterium]